MLLNETEFFDLCDLGFYVLDALLSLNFEAIIKKFGYFIYALFRCLCREFWRRGFR